MKTVALLSFIDENATESKLNFFGHLRKCRFGQNAPMGSN
jgi:hypothetical protein